MKIRITCWMVIVCLIAQGLPWAPGVHPGPGKMLPPQPMPAVLLVFDGAAGASAQDQSGIAQALDEIGMAYEVVDAGTVSITLALLQNYPAVVISEVPLAAAEAAGVQNYVAEGGGVLLTGQAGHGLETVAGIASYAPKDIQGGLEVRFETAHPVSRGAYWDGPIMSDPPMPAAEIPSINQFLYGDDSQPGYVVVPSTGTVLAHWYADADDWWSGQEEPAIVAHEYGQGRAVFSGALPGAYASWAWPTTWRVFVINALEWLSQEAYLVELGYWPDANQAAYVWTGDTETPDMVTAVPAILQVFDNLGLHDFGTFYVVGEAGGDEGTAGALEHPEVVQWIAAAGSEVGGHGDVHLSFDSGNVATDTLRLQHMLAILNPLLAPYGESVRGFRAPHVEYTRQTMQAAAAVGLLYNASEIDVWSETTLPYDNGNLWEAPPSMPMDWTLFEENAVSDADATRIYNDKFDYVYSRRGMFTFLAHPWVIDGHLAVMTDTLQHALDTDGVWMARQDAVVDWWAQRSSLSTQAVIRQGDTLSVTVQNDGSTAVAGASVWLRVREGLDPQQLGARLAGRPLVVKQRQHNGMNFLAAILPQIEAGSQATVVFSTYPAEDARAYQHGIDFVPLADGHFQLIWSSAENPPVGPAPVDPQWIYVDLGAPSPVSHVRLTWEDAYAEAYQIQVSDDALDWTPVFTETGGDGEIDDLTGLVASGRYVRMYGTRRGTEWGYSLYEMEVYSGTLLLSQGQPSLASSYEDDETTADQAFDGDLDTRWSSGGGEWLHDIFASPLDPADPHIVATRLISNPEAQEPASAAINTDGHILVTMEDGWNAENVVAQRFGLYTSDLAPLLPYPQLVLDGGHSGHVAAAGSRFVIFYSEGWVDGGGVDDLGTGDDVYVSVYDTNGVAQGSGEIAVGEATRDWWPLVAASPDRALLVWQRYVAGETYADLMGTVYDPFSGTHTAVAVLVPQVKYYTYDVQYVAAIDRFLVTGTYDGGGGFAYLLDTGGNVRAQNTALPPFVREAQPALAAVCRGAVSVHPTAPTGAMALSLQPNAITLLETVSDLYSWSSIGTDGIFTAAGSVYFASLSTNGLVEKRFDFHSLPLPSCWQTYLPLATK